MPSDNKPPSQVPEKLRGLVPSSQNGKADEAYEAYLETIGVTTEPEVQLALARSGDPRFRRFLELMASGTRRVRVQTVAKQCGIELAEFVHWFSKASSQIAIAIAQRKAAGIVTDMAADALTKDEFCERCDGMTWVSAPSDLPVDTPGYRVMGMRTAKVMRTPEEIEEDRAQGVVKPLKWENREEPIFGRTCPKCGGKGRVREPGNEHARDRVLEIAGVIQKAGKGVQIVQNFGGASHSSAVAMGALTIDVEADEVEEADTPEVPDDGDPGDSGGFVN